MPMMIEKARIGRINALRGRGGARGDGSAVPHWLSPFKGGLRFRAAAH